jgi:hypothetical protein
MHLLLGFLYFPSFLSITSANPSQPLPLSVPVFPCCSSGHPCPSPLAYPGISFPPLVPFTACIWMFFSWFCHLLYECILSHPGDSIFLFHSSEHFAWDSLPSLSGFILYLLEIFPPPSNLFVGSFSLLLYSTYLCSST